MYNLLSMDDQTNENKLNKLSVSYYLIFEIRLRRYVKSIDNCIWIQVNITSEYNKFFNCFYISTYTLKRV